jgi:hypothetical protein
MRGLAGQARQRAEVEGEVARGLEALVRILLQAMPGDAVQRRGDAEVELEEGPRLLSNLVDVAPDPEQLPLDLALEVTFESFGEVTLPLFRPRSR